MNAGERQVLSRLELEAVHCVEIRSTLAIRFANNSKNRPATAAMCGNPRNSNYFFWAAVRAIVSGGTCGTAGRGSRGFGAGRFATARMYSRYRARDETCAADELLAGAK